MEKQGISAIKSTFLNHLNRGLEEKALEIVGLPINQNDTRTNQRVTGKL